MRKRRGQESRGLMGTYVIPRWCACSLEDQIDELVNELHNCPLCV